MIRWQHPVRGLLIADIFLPEMLNSPFLRCLVEWGLETAAEQLAAWRDLGLVEAVDLSMDLPTPLLHAQNLPETLERILVQIGLDPATLALELSEAALSPELIESGVMKRLHERQIGITVDDFGGGSSSLSHLSRLPIKRLKVHSGFTKGLAKANDDTAMVRSIVAMAHNLGIMPIAVEVENADQRARLLAVDCIQMQGTLFAAPAKAADATRWISGWQERRRHDCKLDLLRHA